VASLLDLADAVPASQRDLRAFASTLPGDVGDALRAAVGERRPKAFTHLLLAALDAGQVVDASVLAEGTALLPDPDTVAAVAPSVRGDTGGALVTAVRSRRIGYEHEPAVLLVAELWARRTGNPRPEGVVAESRIRARRQLTHEGEDALVAMAELLDDPHLNGLVGAFSAPDVKEAARALSSRLARRMVEGPLSAMPERPVREAQTRAPVRRAVAKIGRNDPCHCGSGKKYKLCHEAEDRARLADPSDVEGLTGSEVADRLEELLDEERLRSLRSDELARLDPARIAPALHGPLATQLTAWGEVDRAVAVLTAHWRDDLADTAEMVAVDAARDGRTDLVRALAERIPPDRLMAESRLALAEDPAARLATIEDLAQKEIDTAGVDLGFALLAAGLPALGIHVARSELVLRKRDADADHLLAQLRETRDKLLLPPWDPIDDVLFTMDTGHAPQVERELTAARGKVEASDAALKSTQEALDRMRDELARKEAEVARQAAQPVERHERVAAAPAVEDPHVRELRERVEQLRTDLKERHTERNALRRELEDARERMAELQSQPASDGEGEADEPDEDEDGPPLDAKVASRLRIPVFPEDFGDKLRQVPDATARAALMRIGELCAGFDVAFREVRPLRGFEGTWRVKVGRSYRLLFRPENDRLEVLDLLHRQDLEKRLFRLRRGGERPSL